MFVPRKTRKIRVRVVVFLAFTFPFILSSCTENTLRPGPDVPDSTLVSLFTEMQFTRAREEIRRDVDIAFEDSVLARHGFNRAEYEELLRYFSHHPVEFRNMLESVINELEEARIPVDPDQP